MKKTGKKKQLKLNLYHTYNVFKYQKSVQYLEQQPRTWRRVQTTKNFMYFAVSKGLNSCKIRSIVTILDVDLHNTKKYSHTKNYFIICNNMEDKSRKQNVSWNLLSQRAITTVKKVQSKPNSICFTLRYIHIQKTEFIICNNMEEKSGNWKFHKIT